MKCFVAIILTISVTTIQSFESIDYTNEPYALIPIEAAYLYKNNETIIHMSNISIIEEKFMKYEEMYYLHHPKDRKITLLIKKCRDYIEQLTTHRSKRSFNFLGTMFKFITGTPDHNDITLVQEKLNDLIENNNRLAIINTAMQKNFEFLTGNGEDKRFELLFEWMLSELKQIIDTINLAKLGILNTAILNLQEINQIIKVEKNFDAPLMEILEHATFKVIQVKSLYLLLIKYPVIERKCMLYSIRAIALEEGKLNLEPFATQCDGKYVTVRECKKYVSTNICKYYEHTCTQDLLNGLRTNCTMIRERMHEIEEVDDGKILINGKHMINNITVKGTRLILFNDSVIIDQQNYTNNKVLVQAFLERNKPSEYDIINIIESENKKLKIPSLFEIKGITMEIETHPMRSTIIIIITIAMLILVIHYTIRICVAYNAYKTRKTNENANKYARTLFNKNLGTISFEHGSS